MPKTFRPTSNTTPSKSPERLAFEHAVELAPRSGILQLEVAPLDTDDDGHYARLEAVSAVLQRAHEKRGADPSPNEEALLEGVADRSLHVQLSDAFIDVRTKAYDAGYLYGLAVGLMIAGHGGAR